MDGTEFFPVFAVFFLGALLFVVWPRARAESLPKYATLIHDAFKECAFQNLSVRAFSPDDSLFCRKLHTDLFDAGFSPDIGFNYFDDWLKADESQKWIVCSDSQRVACFGLNEFPDLRYAQLSYGLMELECRSKGLGSFALAYRLWSLNPSGNYVVSLWATEHSRPYFIRFGFVEMDQELLVPEERFPDLYHMSVVVSPEDRSFLASYVARNLGDTIADV